MTTAAGTSSTATRYTCNSTAGPPTPSAAPAVSSTRQPTLSAGPSTSSDGSSVFPSLRVSSPEFLSGCGPSLRSRRVPAQPSESVRPSAPGRGRRLRRRGRDIQQLTPQSLERSPSPEPAPHSVGRKRKAGKTNEKGGSGRKKACTSEGRKGKGKAKGKETGKTELWSTSDPATTYPVFSQEFGPTVLLPYDASPTEFFFQVYPPALVDVIVRQTNLYAEQRNVSGWVDTTATEIEAFLGFVMATSVHRVPRLNNIWSGDWVLGVPALAAIFPRGRFWQLWRNLHLVDNTQAPDRLDPLFDRLYKLRPMLDMLGDAFRAAHEPSQQLSVDEAMVRFKGRSSLKQYMPKKPIKRGFKIWCLCDANGGYLQQFQIYTGKETRSRPLPPGENMTYRVVTDLTDNYAGKNHVVYMDNFFTSVKLVEDLEQRNTFCAGTVRTNRIAAIPELLDRGMLSKMDRGDYTFRTKGNVAVHVWKDNKEIYLISNAYPASGDLTVPRKRKEDGVVQQVRCPPVLPGYNKFMGGVDNNDQKSSYYAISRKSRRWWLRIFWHFLDVAVVNAHCLYLENRKVAFHPPLLPQPPMDVLAFRCALIHAFCDGFTARKPTGRPPSLTLSRPAGNHRLVHVRTLGMASGRCKHCSVRGGRRRSSVGRPKKRKETSFACSVCLVRLCQTPCYDLYHR